MASPKTVQVGNVPVGRIGYGLMNLTWTTRSIPDEQAFAALRTAIDAGATFLNGGEFYGTTDKTANLKLLGRFFAQNPSYAEKSFLSVKGGIDLATLEPKGSEADLRKSVENIVKSLGGSKKLDLFECARVDKSRPIEDVIRSLKTLIDEGLFSYIGLSEVSAETIRRAHKVHPIACVEVEYSPWSVEIETNGVLETCRELGITIAAYSPLGRGMLTGTIKSPDDIPEGDFRKLLDRFKPENFYKNLELVDKIKAVADRKNLTTPQLVLAWILAQDPLIMPIPGSTRVEGVKESLSAIDVKLTPAEVAEIREIVNTADIKGGRYYAAAENQLFA